MNPRFDDCRQNWSEIPLIGGESLQEKMDSLCRAVGLLFGKTLLEMDQTEEKRKERHEVVELGLVEASIIIDAKVAPPFPTGRTATIWLMWLPDSNRYNSQGDDPIMFEFFPLWTPVGIMPDSLTHAAMRMFVKGTDKSCDAFRRSNMKKEDAMLQLEKILMKKIYIKFVSPKVAYLEECF